MGALIVVVAVSGSGVLLGYGALASGVVRLDGAQFFALGAAGPWYLASGWKCCSKLRS